MSWCIQKPPDAAQERQWRSRRLGPGACSRDALTLSTGYLRKVTIEGVTPAEREVPYTCGGNDAGRKGTGAKARNSSGQTNMTTVRISRTQDALLITIEAEHYEAMRARGAFLRAGKYLEPVGDSSIGTICWHGEGDTQQPELGTEQAMHDHPPGPRNSGSVTARGIYPNFSACLWQVYLCFWTTSCVDLSLEAPPALETASQVDPQQEHLWWLRCGAMRCRRWQRHLLDPERRPPLVLVLREPTACGAFRPGHY